MRCSTPTGWNAEIAIPLDGRSDTIFVVVRVIPVNLENGSARLILALPNEPKIPLLKVTP